MNHLEWARRHNPALTDISPASPLTVGNGSFAFTADVTGLQTLDRLYAGETPLCTMADWGWHRIPAPVPSGRYTLSDVRMDHFPFRGREVAYAGTRFPETAEAYDWLRQNPHKAHLARIGLRLAGNDPEPGDISGIRQVLDLSSGLLESRYLLQGTPCRVLTCCDPERDILAVRVESDLLREGLTVDLDFPYGSPEISGADWNQPARHRTGLSDGLIRRQMDDLCFLIRPEAPGARITQAGPHRIRIAAGGTCLSLTLAFGREDVPTSGGFQAVADRCAAWWQRFWNRGGMLDLSASADPRAPELERRVVLSLYLLAVNSAGRMPPAETGLTCNSWYGKAHLEMHFWHMAWAPLWGHADLLARALPWYHAHLPQARENAARNGFRGARWPKMVGDDAGDSPSSIAVYLVWQQPHILILLDMLLRAARQERPEAVPALLREHWPLVRETADFMADFPVPDASGIFHLEPPMIPVQERYAPGTVRDPAFETAYWKFGLEAAVRWAHALGEEPSPAWKETAARMAPPPSAEGRYIAHAGAPDTFSRYLDDHPSMLQCFGLLPGRDLDPARMAATLDAVLEKWDYSGLWGWDFAVLAMTALRLGWPETALDQLLCPTPKNTYVASGHNRQASRADLPLYLPGNGSLLLACAMMAAGWDGADRPAPGFGVPGWQAAREGILPWY